MVFVLLPKVLFKDDPSKWLIGLIFIGGIILVNVTFNLPTMVANKGIYLSFPEFVDWLFVVVVGLTTLLMAIKKKAFRAMASLIFVSLINGILKKLVAIGVVSGQLWSVGLPITSLVFGLLLFYLNSYRLLKEADKR